MTAPRLAQATSHGRMYARTRGGAPTVPSITTVLDEMNHRMEWWEALCAVRLSMQHAHRLVDVVDMPNGPEKWSRERAAKDWLMEAAERDRNEAAARGDLVHDYAEAHALRSIGRAGDDEVTRRRELCMTAGLMPYLKHFHAFWDLYQPEVLVPEATVWNATVGYAGTTDLICDIAVHGQPARVVLDYKTRRGVLDRFGAVKPSALQPYTGMQLVAAAHAEELWVEAANATDDRWESFAHDIQVGLGVALGPDGFVVRQYDVLNPLLWKTFTALREVWDFHRDGADLMSGDVSGPDGIVLADEVPRSRQAA